MKRQILKAMARVLTATLILFAGAFAVSASGTTLSKFERSDQFEQLPAGLVFRATPNSSDFVQAAYGGGTAVEFERRSTFRFNAVKDSQGEVTGTLVYMFRDFGLDFKVHVKLDCLTIEGNRAKLSGLITQISANFPLPPSLVGTRASMQVEDNGSANAALPDKYSDFHFFQATCADENEPYIPIDGNIVVVP